MNGRHERTELKQCPVQLVVLAALVLGGRPLEKSVFSGPSVLADLDPLSAEMSIRIIGRETPLV